MGYTGLGSWEASDNAADFVFVYKKASTDETRRSLIDKELKRVDNRYNTDGCVNIALAMEDGIVRRSDLTETQFYTLRDQLVSLKEASSAKFKDHWKEEESRVEHNTAYKRMLKQFKL